MAWVDLPLSLSLSPHITRIYAFQMNASQRASNPKRARRGKVRVRERKRYMYTRASASHRFGLKYSSYLLASRKKCNKRDSLFDVDDYDDQSEMIGPRRRRPIQHQINASRSCSFYIITSLHRRRRRSSSRRHFSSSLLFIHVCVDV